MRDEGRWAPAIIVLVWALSTLLWLTPGVLKPDGVGYYAYLPSTFFDHDLVFFNEWKDAGLIRNGVVLHKEITARGMLGNHWPPGASLFWYPGFLAGDLLRATIPSLARYARSGTSLPYNLGVVYGSAMAGLIALLIVHAVVRKITSPRSALFATIAVWFGTPLLWYALKHATMAHAVSTFAAAAAFALALRLRDAIDGERLLSAGLAAGFAFAVRPQSAPLVFVPLILLVGHNPQGSTSDTSIQVAGHSNVGPPGAWSALRRNGWCYLAGLAVGAATPLIVSLTLYGDVLGFITGGTSAKPFAAFERIWTWEPVFSWYHGLVPWCPIAAIGVIGLVLLRRADAPLAWASLFLFASQWVINAVAERSFWGAFSFGPRRFDSCLLPFALGVAVFIDKMPKLVGTIVTALCALWTMSIFFAALGPMDLGRYLAPAELLRLQIDGLLAAPSHLVALDTIPPALKLTVLTTLLLLTVPWMVSWWLLSRAAPRKRSRICVSLATSYLVLMAGFYAFCGVMSSEHAAEYRELAETNRRWHRAAGGADFRGGLLQDELDYLRRSGRTEKALETERELRELLAARERGLSESRKGR